MKLWFLILSSILFITFVILMPKRISLIELYATTGVALYVQLLTDVYLHLKLNWYGYFSQTNIEWATVWLTPLYLAVNPVYLNFYPYHKRKSVQFFYIMGWSVFSILFEWILELIGVFYHNEWKLYHSAITYPILFLLLRYQLTLVRKLMK